MAAAITESVNNSREPVFTTCHSSQGSTRRPTSSIRAMNAATCSRVWPKACHSGRASSAGAAPPPSKPASGGINTSTSTQARSSTTSQPTAMRPFIESSTPRASRALSNTTVLAHESDSPKINPLPTPQPIHHASPMPSRVATLICTTAPGTARRRTESRSPSEKCSPTPNISSITPISDNCEAMCTSATKPGVAGPIRMPASR